MGVSSRSRRSFRRGQFRSLAARWPLFFVSPEVDKSLLASAAHRRGGVEAGVRESHAAGFFPLRPSLALVSLRTITSPRLRNRLGGSESAADQRVRPSPQPS